MMTWTQKNTENTSSQESMTSAAQNSETKRYKLKYGFCSPDDTSSQNTTAKFLSELVPTTKFLSKPEQHLQKT